jgi:hypothetical protein
MDFNKLWSEYKGTNNQLEALKWLEDWLRMWRMEEYQRFTGIYRNVGETQLEDYRETLKLSDSALYYDHKDHQDGAITFLENVVFPQEKVAKYFVSLWSSPSETPRPTGKVLDGKALGAKRGWLLAAPEPAYWTQRDNYAQWWRTCNCSATAMQLNSLGYPIEGDDAFVREILKRGWNSTHHNKVDWVAQNIFKAPLVFTTSKDFDFLDSQLEQGQAVVLSIKHKGSMRQSYGGHMITCWAKKDENTYIIHDPWGHPHGGVYNDHNGASIPWGKESLYWRWIKRQWGWCRYHDDQLVVK